VTELKIPADAQYIVVAKRAASALGACVGFSLEGIDELNIAVAQACENAILAGDRMWGPAASILKLTFQLVDGGMEVEVQSVPEKAGTNAEVVRRDRQRALELARLKAREQEVLELEQVAVNMIRLFVDEMHSKVDARGNVRMRMVKYLVD
jgi:anti-sigma regulatory factor (Ser/Thr protein kinase)